MSLNTRNFNPGRAPRAIAARRYPGFSTVYGHPIRTRSWIKQVERDTQALVARFSAQAGLPQVQTTRQEGGPVAAASEPIYQRDNSP